jgi:hypothetical protein
MLDIGDVANNPTRYLRAGTQYPADGRFTLQLLDDMPTPERTQLEKICMIGQDAASRAAPICLSLRLFYFIINMALLQSSSGIIMNTCFHLVIAKIFPVLLLRSCPILVAYPLLLMTETQKFKNVNATLILRRRHSGKSRTRAAGYEERDQGIQAQDISR